jgi:hypothetical protein
MRSNAIKRTIQTAQKDHKCFAVCGATIPAGVYYIKDTRTESLGYTNSSTRTLMTIAWHLRCAPEDKKIATKIIDDAIAENAKHPSRTGAEYDNS